MNRNLKSNIRAAFEPPKNNKKDEFLHNLNYPKTNYFDFIYSQVGYIRKRVWTIFTLSLLGVLFFVNTASFAYEEKFIWIISSILPFVALVAISELSRSSICLMSELEMSCKYSLTDVILTRMGILSGTFVLFFSLLIILLAEKTEYGFLRLGLYVLVPFLLTCSLSLYVINKLKTKELINVCGGVSCFISFLSADLVFSMKTVYLSQYLYIWGILFILSLIIIAYQALRYINNMEEIQWNSQ
jgi:hypothetical protein